MAFMNKDKIILISVLLFLITSISDIIAEPLLQKKDVFISGLDNHNIYRIPSLLVSQKGTLLAFSEGRAGDDGSLTDLVVKRSFDNGLTWSPMQTVLKGHNEAWMNPCPVIDHSNGTMFLLCYHVFKSGENKHIGNPFNKSNSVMIVKSVDDGATWSEPVDITASVGLVCPGPGVGIQMKSGRIVIPCYTNESYSQVIFSDDQGQSWRAGTTVKMPTNECQVVELVDGALMLNMRPYKTKKCRYVAISRDGGLTWEKEYFDDTLIDSENQASIFRYTRKDEGFKKNCILFSNAAHATWRKLLTVRVSYDEGVTWPILEIITPGWAGYSCLTVLKDGTIGLLYETGESSYKERITFTRFNFEWLTDGKDSITLLKD